MDIFKEIHRLPYYLYVFDGRAMVLGGQSVPQIEMEYDRIYDLWKKIVELNQKENLNDDEKKQYAEFVQKMAKWNPRNSLSRHELEEKISTLSDKEREDVKWQIEMYKLGREYYRDYVHSK